MPKFDDRAGKSAEPATGTEVQYLLVGTLIGAILLMILYSLLTVH